MARFTPSGTTAATTAQATAPAPQPKPTTATLPAPSKPATTTAPAAPRAAAPKAPATTAAEDAEKARRRAAFEAESKAAQEELGSVRPYLEAVGKIAEMRRAGQIGVAAPTMEGDLVASPRTRSTAPGPAAVSAQPQLRDPKSRGEALPPVAPWRPQTPSASSLNVPMRAAVEAEAVDAAYKRASAEWEAAERDIREKEADPNFPRSQFLALAQAQRARLQRVAELAAARREYGLTD